ncbi:MAG: YHS domain-containing protein [Dehalococcoidia bacterium]|nr:YHS domain-containing protein [Dehalococcoidia bacterium]
MRVPFVSGKQDRGTDPVCHMQVDKKNPPGGSWEYKSETYYFCGPGCNRAFQKDPESYLSGSKSMHM